MTIYDSRKILLSPYLTKMITLVYKYKLERLSSHDLSKLLCSLGIFEFERNPEISPNYAEITGVNRRVYDSYNENQFFQWVICYHLDSLGLLYYHPRAYFEKSSQSMKYWSPTTRVRIPDGFIPQSRYESRKKSSNRFCRIDESLKFDPKSFQTITVEEVNELKRQAFLKQEDHHYYLRSERNRAIEAINGRHNLTPQQKELRVKRIEKKYQRNLMNSAEETVVQQQLATPESQERYFAGIQSRKTHENNETFLKFSLSDFDTNVRSIRELDELIKNVESNLGKIKSVVENNNRINMHASFNVSTKKVRLCLGHKAHDIELSQYLYHLKEGTRKSDIKIIEEFIGKICSNLSVWIDSLRCFNERVSDLSKIRDTVKLYWRASFDISTKKVCLTHPDEKVEHLDIPEYVGYLRRRIAHFQEILAEKKRMCE